MIWQNETIYRGSNSRNKVILKFSSRTWLNVIFIKPRKPGKPKSEPLVYRIQVSAPPSTKNAQVRHAAERMCEHFGISFAETLTIAAEIRKFIEQRLW